ncbi:hypothetical protein [Horticoccus sp. 23ND18S-11]|uniref:hypothetical protein n=1 Tax=Horticoccus sp. 23ND18S-11 TaxID=3391832 RepID=UPI0039C9CF45
MRLRFPALLGCAVLAVQLANGLRATDASRPDGKLLFQPQFLWANSETTLQGTGYVIAHEGKTYGVTSIHFLNFNAGGLHSATWLDVYSERPLATFRTSLGRPLRTAITTPRHVADDFLLLPLTGALDEGTKLQLEAVERYEVGTAFWFPNKSRDHEAGYVWIEARVVEDAGHLIKVRLGEAVTPQSQSGSPLLNAATGKVAGMVNGAEEENGRTILVLCPARAIVKYLARPRQPVSLQISISRRR